MHVAKEHMKALRAALMAVPHNNCCAAHGDLPSRRPDLRHFRHRLAIEVVDERGAAVYASPALVALTAYWEAQPEVPLDQPIRCVLVHMWCFQL